MKFPRSSGVLLHFTSLPGRFGIGDLGPCAFEFADFLTDAGQKLWQVLPLNPTGYGDSPYQCFSAFAGNTLLLSLDYQVAAPAETRTPNLHRANNRSPRVRMEGWRQWATRLGRRSDQHQPGKTNLTPTGLLMEGVSAQNPRSGVNECYRDFSPIDLAVRYLAVEGTQTLSGASISVPNRP